MLIRDVASLEELRQCCLISLQIYNKNSIVPVNEDKAWKSMKNRWYSKGYIKCIVINNKIAGWFCANKLSYSYSNATTFNLEILHHNQSNFTGVKIIRLVHNELIKYAILTKQKTVCSNSILPTMDTFNRILSKDGWQQNGCQMIYKIT
mgnify:CR=1 FL=1